MCEQVRVAAAIDRWIWANSMREVLEMRSRCRTALQNQTGLLLTICITNWLFVLRLFGGPRHRGHTFPRDAGSIAGVFLALGMMGWERERGPVTVENYVTGVRTVSLMPPSLFPRALGGPARSHQNANLPFKNPPPRAALPDGLFAG